MIERQLVHGRLNNSGLISPHIRINNGEVFPTFTLGKARTVERQVLKRLVRHSSSVPHRSSLTVGGEAGNPSAQRLDANECSPKYYNILDPCGTSANWRRTSWSVVGALLTRALSLVSSYSGTAEMQRTR